MLSITTLTPVADTFTRAGVDAGSATVLDVRDWDGANDWMAYVRFDLSGYVVEDITSATLSFYKMAASRNDTIVTDRFDVYGLLDVAGNTPQDWDEATLADGNLGAEYTNTGGDQLDFGRVFNLDQESGADVVETVSNIDFTPQSITGPDLVTFLLNRADDDGLVTFITLVDAGDRRGWGYGSRENATPERRPTLELDFDGEPVPDPYPEDPIVLPRQMEQLDRGIVAMRSAASQVYVGWRMLGNDPADVAFNLYRSVDGGRAAKLNATPLTETTDFVDTTVDVSRSNTYFVRPVIDGVEQAPSVSYTLEANAPTQQYLNVPLQIPAGGTTPDDVSYTYSANDASVGDVDGDGQYEIILKWDPSNAKDNSHSGYTGNVYVDAYEMSGELLWRIDLGINIRAGAHYTQFMVYDLDGDGRAEVAMKTAPGTVDGLGNDVILSGDDPSADYRNSSGYILAGPEYLTVFDGLTGGELVTVPYDVPRHPDTEYPTSAQLDAIWGDGYGNRVDRFLACIAYLDGVHPSLVMARGYYTRATLAAWDFRDGQLTERWLFDSADGTPGNWAYSGQGNHNLSVADVDGDGKDEIIYGACAIDDDGTGLYSTLLGHGDALHVSDMDPSNPGLEVFQPHEDAGAYGGAGGEFRDAMTGELLFGIPGTGDVGRGVAFDIDPNYPGYEMWTGNIGIYSSQGQVIYDVGNAFVNFGIWWDADPLRELLDGTTIAKWHYEWSSPGRQNLVYAPSGLTSNNGTKKTPTLTADLFGDWREEVIWRRSDNTALQIWTTTIPSEMRLFTLMHDSQYREAVAWQNVAYNQPPHPSFFLGAGMETPPPPKLFFGGELTGDYNLDDVVDTADYSVWRDTLGSTDNLTADGNHDGIVGPEDYDVWKSNFGAVAAAAVTSTVGSGELTGSANTVAAATAASEAVPESPLATGELLPVLGGSLPTLSRSELPSHAAGARARERSLPNDVGAADLRLLLLNARDDGLSRSLARERLHADGQHGHAPAAADPHDAALEDYRLDDGLLKLPRLRG